MRTTIPQAPAADAAPPQGAAALSVEDIHQMTRDAIKTAVGAAQRLGYLEGRLSALDSPPGPAERLQLLAEQDLLSAQIGAVADGAR